jgi:hypothetical protein
MFELQDAMKSRNARSSGHAVVHTLKHSPAIVLDEVHESRTLQIFCSVSKDAVQTDRI